MRILAKFVDILLFFLLTYIMGIPGLFLGSAYILFSDTGSGFSIGKKLTGLKVVMDSTEPTWQASCIRNVPVLLALLSFYIPFLGLILGFIFFPFLIFEIYLIWKEPSGQRMGDMLTSTRVLFR